MQFKKVSCDDSGKCRWKCRFCPVVTNPTATTDEGGKNMRCNCPQVLAPGWGDWLTHILILWIGLDEDRWRWLTGKKPNEQCGCPARRQKLNEVGWTVQWWWCSLRDKIRYYCRLPRLPSPRLVNPDADLNSAK